MALSTASWVFGTSFTDKSSTGTIYMFPIKGYIPYPETFTTTKSNILSGDVFTPATMATYLIDLYASFLKIFQSKFAKPYTPAQLLRLTQHSYKIIHDLDSNANDIDEYEWTFIPAAIQLIGNRFNIIWHLSYKEIKIILADDSVESGITEQLEELDINAVVPSTNDFLRLNSTTQQREAMKLEKARLKARMAKYQAERAMAKYLAKYGDFSEGETDYDSGSDSDSSSCTDRDDQ